MSKRLHLHPGSAAALAAALLFGASTPLAKPLLAQADPWLLAALLYLGSGIGLGLLRLARGAPAVRLGRGEWRWLLAAIVAGGVLAPVLLMLGLRGMTASSAALLLNAEGVFTVLLAWGLFGEALDRRLVLGMGAIAAGALLLVWQPGAPHGAALGVWPALAILGACLGWALDNNLLRKVALADAGWLAMVKGLCAGVVNLALALLVGAAGWPDAGVVAGAALLGFVSYGVSLALFVVGMRELGVARAGAYFSVAPFFGAGLGVLLLGEPLGWPLLAAAALMLVGVALHLAERHRHRHAHEPLAHEHMHRHGPLDEHHTHTHDVVVPPGIQHAHPHRHGALTHEHPHYPDAHHRHRHVED